MSLIEEQLMRLKKEAEDRAARRSSARSDRPGILEIGPARAAELAPHIGTFEDFRDAFGQFDYEQGDMASFLELLFSGAAALAASDVHFEPEEGGARLRLRLDGLLYDVAALPAPFYRLLASRIKISGGMKLNAERPQDGHFTVRFENKDVEVRLSSAPAAHGETFVARLLDPAVISIGMDGLGLRPDDLALVTEEVARPNGMILNTGPTGSGKTTTLYAFLKKRSRPEEKIITIEDPIEYSLPGIEQTQVNPAADYSFATGLRAIVRQDPDVILIGEIRDGETAQVAIQAALTGHVVFSTVHANDAAGAIPRLADLGVDRASIGPAVRCIIGQRLVRRLCDACKRPKAPDAALAASIAGYLAALPARATGSDLGDTLYEPVGCGACNRLGYKGRIGIFEIMPIGVDIGELIASGAGESEIRRHAAERGMVTMQADGVLKALRGITTLEEVEAATGRVPFGHIKTPDGGLATNQ